MIKDRKIKEQEVKMSIYVGIDVGKFFHITYCLYEKRSPLVTLKFDNDLTGFTDLEKLGGGLSIQNKSTTSGIFVKIEQEFLR